MIRLFIFFTFVLPHRNYSIADNDIVCLDSVPLSFLNYSECDYYGFDSDSTF